MSTTTRQHAAPSTRGQRALIGAAIVLFAALSAYLALVIVTRVDSLFSPGRQITLPSAVGKVLPGVDAEGESGITERINIMVMGLDRRPVDGDSPTRTDTLFVVTIDPKTDSASILGIPRDLWVEMPLDDGSVYEDRINTAYATGELGDYDGGGIGLLERTIEHNFDVDIHKYVIVDFEGFEEIIDALGGIEVDVPDEVYDPYYSETELLGDYDPQHFYPGVQQMDGPTALAYSRIRFSSDDLDRIQRQQRVIFAAIEKAVSLNVLKNADSLWGEYKDAIKTDISDFQIPGYALLANGVKDNITAVSLGPATAPIITDSGASVLIGDDEAIQRIVDSIFSDAPVGELPVDNTPPQPVRVEVQNATGSDGLASRVVDYIASKGYPIDDLNPTNPSDGLSRTTSEIIDIDGLHEKNTYLIAAWLNIPIESVRIATADEREAMETTDATIVVVLGSDLDFDTQIQSEGGFAGG